MYSQSPMRLPVASRISFNSRTEVKHPSGYMAVLTGSGSEIDGREELLRDIPWQQLFNTINGVIGNTSKDLA